MKRLKYLIISIFVILNLQLLYSQNAIYPDDRVIKYDGDDGKMGFKNHHQESRLYGKKNRI